MSTLAITATAAATAAAAAAAPPPPPAAAAAPRMTGRVLVTVIVLHPATRQRRGVKHCGIVCPWQNFNHGLLIVAKGMNR